MKGCIPLKRAFAALLLFVVVILRCLPHPRGWVGFASDLVWWWNCHLDLAQALLYRLCQLIDFHFLELWRCNSVCVHLFQFLLLHRRDQCLLRSGALHKMRWSLLDHFQQTITNSSCSSKSTHWLDLIFICVFDASNRWCPSKLIVFPLVFCIGFLVSSEFHRFFTYTACAYRSLGCAGSLVAAGKAISSNTNGWARVVSLMSLIRRYAIGIKRERLDLARSFAQSISCKPS